MPDSEVIESILTEIDENSGAITELEDEIDYHTRELVKLHGILRKLRTDQDELVRVMNDVTQAQAKGTN